MVEQRLRQFAQGSWHPFALVMQRRGGGTFFPPAALPEALRGYPSPPGQCFAVAVAMSRELGFELRLGFALPDGELRPRAHCFVLDLEGRVVDAAWQRRGALGYLGFAPTGPEREVLEQANASQIEGVEALRKLSRTCA